MEEGKEVKLAISLRLPSWRNAVLELGVGRKVSCLDLKGAGIDRTDTNTIYKFDEYNQPLINFMSHLPDDEKARLSTFKSIWVSILD
ncbi:methylesterase 17-like protein [Cinnamomum micranthum f. kanehirae]|uniref:Methylesterase 17-like protein n=1 Tax=Cinnamomum micranthum f. kanehirae TaxID=337451 RepID=A0A443NPS5_9MAGN|nr:methylesterase 17-like protein [Cinnamomum micranthum f. kanehirae]